MFISEVSDVTKKERFRQKMLEYMARAEELKKFVRDEKTGAYIYWIEFTILLNLFS